jgi:chromate transporter
VERLREVRRLACALTGITAAVVGVILNLALWFGWHALHSSAGWDWFAAGLCLAAFVLMRWLKASVIVVVLIAGVAGLLYKQALGT